MNDNKRVLIPIRARGDLIGFWIPGAGPAILFRSLFIMPVLTGTHLTEECLLNNKSGLTSLAAISINAAKYYPTTYGATIPTADSATATTLRDTSVFTVDDYYNDCWVVIVDGTGTDNGPVQITDTDGINGDIIVAAWPGTQPAVTVTLYFGRQRVSRIYHTDEKLAGHIIKDNVSCMFSHN